MCDIGDGNIDEVLKLGSTTLCCLELFSFIDDLSVLFRLDSSLLFTLFVLDRFRARLFRLIGIGSIGGSISRNAFSILDIYTL